MESTKQKKNMKEKALGVLLTLTIAGFFYAPSFAPRAHAIFGVVDTSITTDVAALVKRLLDAGAQIVAKRLVDNMVKSTITWANTGFEGNPAYITNPGNYFGKIGEGVISDTIANDPTIGLICSPFQAKIKLSIVQQYVQTYQPQCTFDQIGRNLTDFYKSFSAGGWGAWFDMTQQDNNNPYGSYLNVKSSIDTKLANQLGVAQQDRQINSGFLDYKPCLAVNVEPPKDFIEAWSNGESLDGGDIDEEKAAQYPNWDPYKPAGACIKYSATSTTPGSVIAKQLNDTLPTGLNKLVNATQIDQLINAFATGLLQRYVFGPKGLFGDNYADSFKGADAPSVVAPEFGWIDCAKEGEKCEFDGEERVRFGSGTNFNELTLTDGTMCTSDVFGDVKATSFISEGLPKKCQYYVQTKGVFVPSEGSSNWVHCANEGSTCSFSGTRQVRIGADGIYNVAIADGSIKCSVSNFGGDPAVGVAKTCEYRGIAPPTVTPVDTLSCSADHSVVSVGDSVVWSVGATPTTTASYIWQGDDVTSQGPTTDTTITATYNTLGMKSMSVQALDADGHVILQSACDNPVNVSDSTKVSDNP